MRTNNRGGQTMLGGIFFYAGLLKKEKISTEFDMAVQFKIWEMNYVKHTSPGPFPKFLNGNPC